MKIKKIDANQYSKSGTITASNSLVSVDITKDNLIMKDTTHMLVIKSKFFDSCLEDIEENNSLSEAKIHEAKQYFNHHLEYQKTMSEIGFNRDLESLPYAEFKTYDYLINYGYISNPKLKETKTSKSWTNWFNDETTSTVYILAALILIFFMGFAAGSGNKTESCVNSSIEKTK